VESQGIIEAAEGLLQRLEELRDRL